MESTEQTETQEISLKPSAGTYLRLGGVVAADVVTVASMFVTFDWRLALVLSVLIVVATAAAAWYNNSVSAAAIAGDCIKDALSDAETQEQVKSAWKSVNETFLAVWAAFKEKSNGQ